MQPKQFFAKLKPGAYQTWHKYKVLPSVVAAQGALESAWGESGLTKRANNVFGIKGSYKGQSVSMSTMEDGPGGMYGIVDGFRKYPSWNESIMDHGQLLGTKQPYTGLRIPGDKDYKSVAAKLTGSYATDRGYAGKIIGIIEANGLRKWDLDAFNGGDGGGFFGGGDEYKTFQTDLIKKNKITRPEIKLKNVKGIVIHEVRTGLSVEAFKKQLDSGNSGNRMGYHVIIDSKTALGVVPISEGVYHADRTGTRVIKELGNANENTLSIGLLTSNGNFSDSVLKKAALTCGEIMNIKKIPSHKIWYGYLVDNYPEPMKWIENNFLYTSFLALAAASKEAGQEVITNPNYEKEENGGSDGGAMIPGGKGIIKKLIDYSLGFEGKIRYILGARDIRVGGVGDCASYTQAMFLRTTGRDIGPNTWAQIKQGSSVPVSQLRAGDLVFFNGDSNPPSHVGLVIGKDTMINLQLNGCVVEKISNWHNYGSPPQWGRRLFSDADYEEAMNPNNGKKPDINTKKPYVIGVSKPKKGQYTNPAPTQNRAVPVMAMRTLPYMNARMKRSAPVPYNIEVPTKTINPGERYRAINITKDNVEIEEGLILPRDSQDIIYFPLNTPYDEIGILTTKLKTSVYTEPSLSSLPVEDLGTIKYHPPGTTLSVYAIKNGLIQVTAPGYVEEWVPMSPSYVDLQLYNLSSFTQDLDYSEGRTVETTAVMRELPSKNYKTEEDIFATSNGLSLIANELFLPVGSVVEIQVPTNRDFNRTGVVVSNSMATDNPNSIEIFGTGADVYNFGRRTVRAKIVGSLSKSEIPSFLEGKKEDEDETFT